MLNWASIFMAIALFALGSGFKGISDPVAGMVEFCFVVFMLLFLVSTLNDALDLQERN